MRRSVGGLALGIGLALTGPLAAQSKPLEFGLDGGFSTQFSGSKVSQIGIPIQRFRIGFTASDRIEIEPAVALNWLKPSGSDALTTIEAGVGVLVHFATDAEKAKPYLRPFVGVSHVTSSGSSATQVEAGVGLGVKIPITSVPRFAFRLEAGYSHGFEGDFAASDNLNLLFGLSFFTK